MDKLVSIIVPIYKAEKYLDHCVPSLINQSYKNLEIILVNDGSTDDSGLLCDNFAKIDSRIRVLHKTNGGVSDARNCGLKMAKGEYIAFVDSDDFIHERFIEVLYKMCEENCLPIAQCRPLYLTLQNFHIPKNNMEYEIKIYDNLDMLQHLYSKHSATTNVVWNKLFRKDLFDNISFPVGRIMEDFSTSYLLIYAAKKIAVTEEPLYYYFRSENSYMRSGYNLKRLDVLAAYEERLDFFTSINHSELYNKSLYWYRNSLLKNYFMCRKYYRKLKENKQELRRKLIRSYCNYKYKNHFSFKVRYQMMRERYFPKFTVVNKILG
ncbi:MAG: glycosyl transferase family protein [Herbinix sp.]|jgi:glycosyltransferase involved in cell wall biosynthesis|nr:glycosyl transferase family protein [Herbinix sp.]